MPNLANYIEANGVSRKALAEALGVDRTTVWRLVTGRTRPHLDMMLDIQRVTNGAVDLNSWASLSRADASSNGDTPAARKGRAA